MFSWKSLIVNVTCSTVVFVSNDGTDRAGPSGSQKDREEQVGACFSPWRSCSSRVGWVGMPRLPEAGFEMVVGGRCSRRSTWGGSARLVVLTTCPAACVCFENGESWAAFIVQLQFLGLVLVSRRGCISSGCVHDNTYGAIRLSLHLSAAKKKRWPRRGCGIVRITAHAEKRQIGRLSLPRRETLDFSPGGGQRLTSGGNGCERRG